MIDGNNEAAIFRKSDGGDILKLFKNHENSRKIHAMNCCICNKLLIGSYMYDVWDNKMCESHFNKDVVHCSSCTAFTKREHILPDGRVLCKRCFEDAIKSGDSIEKIKTFVINALRNAGFNDLRIQDISFEIVTAQRLAEIRKAPVDLKIKGFTSSNLNTITLYGFSTSKKFRHNIYVLTHLVDTEFAGTLAHEFLHAWLFQNSVKMSHKLDEGFCNMGSYLIYRSIPGAFAKMQLKFLYESTDPIYGDGFREMYAHFKRLGWKEMIRKVKRKSIFSGVVGLTA